MLKQQQVGSAVLNGQVFRNRHYFWTMSVFVEAESPAGVLKADDLSLSLPGPHPQPDIEAGKSRTDDRSPAKANRMTGYNYKGAFINQSPCFYLHSLVLHLKPEKWRCQRKLRESAVIFFYYSSCATSFGEQPF